MNWISRLLCLLGMHGPNWLGETSQYRSNIVHYPTYSSIRPLYEPRKHRRCECCGAEWKWQLAYKKLSQGRAKKMPFEWVKIR